MIGSDLNKQNYDMVFISHRSIDKNVADIFVDFLKDDQGQL